MNRRVILDDGKKVELRKLLDSVEQCIAYLDKLWCVQKLSEKIKELSDQTLAPDFWSDQDRARLLMKEKSLLEFKQNTVQEYKDLCELYRLMLDESDCDAEVDGLVQELSRAANRTKLSCLFDDTDKSDCFVQVKAGAGGREARDWAGMVFRMYYRYAQKVGYQVKVLEEVIDADGMDSGLLQVLSQAGAQFPYGYLKHEAGAHRLVRISPFDSNKNRHTSFVGVDVFPVVDETIQPEIDEKDLERHFCRASGAGGQHVNKTDSAVQLHHKPTGIMVRCQSDRSQHANLKQAMAILHARLYQRELDKQQQDKQARLDSLGSMAWGSQVRSYVLHPYKLVTDIRTRHEDTNPDRVLEGDIQAFLDSAVARASLAGEK